MTRISLQGAGGMMVLTGAAWTLAGFLGPDIGLWIGAGLATAGLILTGLGGPENDSSDTNEDVPLGPEEIEEEYEQ